MRRLRQDLGLGEQVEVGEVEEPDTLEVIDETSDAAEEQEEQEDGELEGPTEEELVRANDEKMKEANEGVLEELEGVNEEQLVQAKPEDLMEAKEEEGELDAIKKVDLKGNNKEELEGTKEVESDYEDHCAEVIEAYLKKGDLPDKMKDGENDRIEEGIEVVSDYEVGKEGGEIKPQSFDEAETKVEIEANSTADDGKELDEETLTEAKIKAETLTTGETIGEIHTEPETKSELERTEDLKTETKDKMLQESKTKERGESDSETECELEANVKIKVEIESDIEVEDEKILETYPEINDVIPKATTEVLSEKENESDKVDIIQKHSHLGEGKSSKLTSMHNHGSTESRIYVIQDSLDNESEGNTLDPGSEKS